MKDDDVVGAESRGARSVGDGQAGLGQSGVGPGRLNPLGGAFETERLVVRAMDMADLESVVAYRSDPRVMRYLSYGEALSSDEVSDRIATRIHEMANPSHDEVRLTLVAELREAPGTIVGDCGATLVPIWTKDGAEPSRLRRATINYALAPGFAGVGLGTELVAALVRHLFEQPSVHKVVANVFAENTPSCRVLERVGFTREAYCRDNADLDGRLVDDCQYAMLRHEWEDQ